MTTIKERLTRVETELKEFRKFCREKFRVATDDTKEIQKKLSGLQKTMDSCLFVVKNQSSSLTRKEKISIYIPTAVALIASITAIACELI